MNKLDLSYSWCKTGVFALAIAGLYSIVLVMLRAPLVSDFFANKDFFKTALVVHVDLSILVWLLAGSVMIWLRSSNLRLHPTVDTISRTAFIGVLIIVVSPFLSESSPILNNYIPMLDNFWFVLGVSIFVASVLVMSLILLKNPGSGIFIVSAICLVASYRKIMIEIPYPMDLYGFYEMLFWSGGHALQFLYMHTMYVSLITILGPTISFPRLYKTAVWSNLILSTTLIPVHFMYNIDTSEFITFCTDHMKYAGGIAGLLILTSVIAELSYSSSKWKVGVICSIALFVAGGVIALFISEVNVTIPAHYHGSIVGISLAVMCLVYYSLDEKIDVYAEIQMISYTFGQLLHIAGLAWSGGYGVLRKDPTTILSLKAKISMGMMGLGGMIAIIGGLMFVVICARKVFKTQ